jgi:hypothetical protein
MKSHVLVVPFVGLLSLPVWLAPAHVVFKEFGVADVAQLMTILFLVAVLAERALEIFVSTWRGPVATEHESAVRKATDDVTRLTPLAQAKPRALADAQAALDEARRQEQTYRCGTRQVALWGALGLGLLVSGVGLRALETLIDPAANGWSVGGQGMAFRLVDVLLTGGVIAGGSEGIHRVAAVCDNFRNATAKRAKANA